MCQCCISGKYSNKVYTSNSNIKMDYHHFSFVQVFLHSSIKKSKFLMIVKELLSYLGISLLQLECCHKIEGQVGCSELQNSWPPEPHGHCNQRSLATWADLHDQSRTQEQHHRQLQSSSMQEITFKLCQQTCKFQPKADNFT